MKKTLKLIWPSIKHHQFKLFLSFFLTFISSASQALIPEVFRLLIDRGWTQGNKKLAFLIPLLFLFLWVLSSFCRYFQTIWIKKIGVSLIFQLKTKLMNKYLNSNLFLLNKHSFGSGGLISRLTNDLSKVELGFSYFSNLLREPIVALCVYGYLLFLNPILTFFITLTLFLTSWISRKIAKSLQKYSHLNQQSAERLSKTLKESLDGLRMIQAFLLESKISSKFQKELQNLVMTKNKLIERETAVSPIFNVITAFGTSSLLYYVNFLIFQTQLTIGEFTSFFVSLIILLNATRRTQDSYVCLQQSFVALERFENLMKSPTELKEFSPPLEFPKDWKEIEFKNVSFSYHGSSSPALQNISFHVKRGEKIAVVGESGSGKSTLVHLLARFFDPQKGDIFIGKAPINKVALKSLRANISLVSQDLFLFEGSIEENIRAGLPSQHHLSVQKAAQRAGAHDFIQKLKKNYHTSVGESGFRLSGGEKQRISLARAFFKNAPILILDEATSALDAENEKKVQKGLQKLMENRTTFIITHRLSMISEVNKVFILQQGKLLQTSSLEDFRNFQDDFLKKNEKSEKTGHKSKKKP